MYLDLLLFINNTLNSSQKYLGTEKCDFKEKMREIIQNIKLKINETEVKLDKVVHTEIDLFNDKDDNKELIIYKRLVKFDKFPRYFKQKKIDDNKLFLASEFDDCFGAGGLYNIVSHAMSDLHSYVDLFEKYISDEEIDFEQVFKSYKYFMNELPVFIKRSNDEKDYSFLFLEFLKRLRKIYNEKVIHLSFG